MELNTEAFLNRARSALTISVAGMVVPFALGSGLALAFIKAPGLFSDQATLWTTDAIGIHAVFGGFLLGVAMPRGFFARELQRQLEPFAVVFLLPRMISDS